MPTRVDKQVDFDWNAASPGEGIPLHSVFAGAVSSLCPARAIMRLK